MQPVKNKSFVIALILFLITLVSVVTGFFPYPKDSTSEFMDKVFYFVVNITFWLSAAFLLNILLRKVLWGGIFKTSAGSKSLGQLEDFLVTFIYLLSGSIIIVKVFNQDFSAEGVLFFILLLFAASYMRPKLLRLFSNAFIISTRPFKVGDSIKLISKNGDNTLIGEILTFDRIAIQLKSQDGTLLVFPHPLLDEFIIENYKAIKNEVRFNLNLELSSSVPVSRSKRILLAAARQATLELSDTPDEEPLVLVHQIIKGKIDYKIYFKMNPWEKYSPEKAKDIMLSKIIEHMKIAGIGLDGEVIKQDVFGRVTIFDMLKKEEKEKLYQTSRKRCFNKGITLINQGESGSSMYVLSEGLLNVFIKAEGKETADIKVGLITPGEFFGEMSLFTGEDRSATVIADTDSVVFEITKEAIRSIIECNPGLVKEFGQIMAERQSANLHKLDEYRNRKDSFIEKFISRIKSYFEL